MSIADRVREVTETLPVEKQDEILNFVEFLRNRTLSGASERDPEREAKLRSVARSLLDAVLKSERDAEREAQLRSDRFGVLRDAFSIAADFDAPLPEEILRDFEGG
jgi:hypothetical protein